MAVAPDKAILSATMVTLGSTVAASVVPTDHGGKGELPKPRLLLGTALTFAGLSMMGDFAPKVAVPLSACIAVTALTYYGVPILQSYFDPTQTTPGPGSGKFTRPTLPSGKVLP
jgi:hypothetical protein